MKIRLLKITDRIIGVFAARVLKSPVKHAVSHPFTSVLLIRPGGLGDAVHLLFSIRLLKNRYPDAAIDILAERRNASVFGLSPDIRKVLRYDVSSEFAAMLWSPYDIVIDTEQWHRLSAVVARVTKAGLRIGFDTNERRRMFNTSVPYAHDQYEVANFLRLLQPLGITPVPVTVPWLMVPPTISGNAELLLAPFVKQQFVTIFPGASIPARRWGADRFREVALSLRSKGLGIVVVGGREDCATGDRICADGVGLNLAGKTSLAETAAVIDRSALLISGDSGILHIGVALGKPTVSLFGPGIAAKWAPRGERHIVLNRNLPCSPCTKFGTTPPCPDGVRCMAEITAQEVVAAVERLIFPAEAATG